MSTQKFGLLIDAKVKGANGIKRLGNSMQGAQGKVKNLTMAVRGLSSAFKLLAAGAVVAGFGAMVKRTIDQADAFGKLSTRTGIAADKLQAYVNAGKLADVSQEQLTSGLRVFARTQIEASEGVATYADAYKKLGVAVKNQDGSLKASDQLLGEIADRFADLPDGPEKAAVAMDIFGRSGAQMITLLNGGKSSLEEFNYELSANFAQNAEYFNDQITKLQIGFDGFRNQLMDALLPALNAIMEVFRDLFSSEQDFSALFMVIEGGIRGVAAVALSLVQAFRFFARTLTDLVKIADALRKGNIGGAIDIAKTGLSDTGQQFFADIEAQRKVLFGRSEAPDSYFRRSAGRSFAGVVATAGASAALGKADAQISDTMLQLLNQINRAKESGNAFDLNTLQYKRDILEIEETSLTGNNKLKALDDARTNLNLRLQGIYAANVEETKELNEETEKTSNIFSQIKDTVATGLTNAIEGLIDGTKTLGESLNGILRQMASMFLQFGMKSALGKLFPNAKGNVFAANKIVPFAYGGVVNRPTLFPMANGMGLMGEAGPEAVMPLRRGRNGRLGVEAGGGVGNVVVNVDATGTTAEGDTSRSRQLGNAIGVAVRQELLKQKRPGGLLA